MFESERYSIQVDGSSCRANAVISTGGDRSGLVGKVDKYSFFIII